MVLFELFAVSVLLDVLRERRGAVRLPTYQPEQNGALWFGPFMRTLHAASSRSCVLIMQRWLLNPSSMALFLAFKVVLCLLVVLSLWRTACRARISSSAASAAACRRSISISRELAMPFCHWRYIHKLVRHRARLHVCAARLMFAMSSNVSLFRQPVHSFVLLTGRCTKLPTPAPTARAESCHSTVSAHCMIAQSWSPASLYRGVV
jgi:hypothetical protein